jgi:hypothetical protein
MRACRVHGKKLMPRFHARAPGTAARSVTGAGCNIHASSSHLTRQHQLRPCVRLQCTQLYMQNASSRPPGVLLPARGAQFLDGLAAGDLPGPLLHTIANRVSVLFSLHVHERNTRAQRADVTADGQHLKLQAWCSQSWETCTEGAQAVRTLLSLSARTIQCRASKSARSMHALRIKHPFTQVHARSC